MMAQPLSTREGQAASLAGIFTFMLCQAFRQSYLTTAGVTTGVAAGTAIAVHLYDKLKRIPYEQAYEEFINL